MGIIWNNNERKEFLTMHKSSLKGLLPVLLCAAVAATAMCNAYPFFRERASEKLKTMQQEYEAEQEKDPLFELDDDFKRYLLSSVYYMNYEMTPDMDAYTYFTQNYDMSKFSEEDQKRIKEASMRLMKNMRNQYSTLQSLYGYGSYGSGPSRDFGNDGYLSGAIYGNSKDAMEYDQSVLVIQYDSRGVPGIRESWGFEMNEEEVLHYLQQASMARLMEDNGMADSGIEYEGEPAYDYDTVATVEERAEEWEESVIPDVESEPEDLYAEAQRNDQLLKLLPAPPIQNTSFVFTIQGEDAYGDYLWQEYWVERRAYQMSGYVISVLGIAVVMMLLAVVLQNVPGLRLRENRLFRLPTELVLYAGCIGFLATGAFAMTDFGVYSMKSDIVEDLAAIGFGGAAQSVSTVFIWVFWFCFAFCWYWLAASVLPYMTHPIRTLRENMLCLHFCRWLKKIWLKFWYWATDVKLDENLTSNIWKVVGLNGVVVAALCCIWIGGIAGAVVYTILLYVLIKKKCAEIQGNYEKLLQVTRTIASGDLNASTEEDMGLFNPIRDELTSIRNGFRRAVSDEVRSRNMKTELITNVSHDLKTPLTAIITYVDLLKKEGITEAERGDYIETLDKKSQRLKALIEDLFEVSKAASDNIVMNFEEVELVSLMKQVRLENEDKIGESTLDFRWNLPEEKCILTLDPQRTFRVMENLVQNILKYSMPHSRVYIDLKDMETEVSVSFKNMSATEMNFSADEITERFVRGDLSRNTEGSGLGLAIAQSFVELQNGTFKVEIDGDLFKVLIDWKR